MHTMILDVMGELRAIRSTITDRLPRAQRVMLTLRLEGDVNVCVSMILWPLRSMASLMDTVKSHELFWSPA